MTLPLYEFRCLKCNEIFELFIKNRKDFVMPFHFSDTCDEEQTERIVSHSSFQLKGSCWYKDGYTKPTQKTNLQNSSEEKIPAQKSGPKILRQGEMAKF